VRTSNLELRERFALYLFQKPSLKISVVPSAVLLCSVMCNKWTSKPKRHVTFRRRVPHAAYATVKEVQVLRSALLWDNLQQYLRFGTSIGPIFQSHKLSWLLELIGCPETSVGSTNISCEISQKSADLIYVATAAWNDARTRYDWTYLMTLYRLRKLLCGT
jgi:hypothetical protein